MSAIMVKSPPTLEYVRSKRDDILRLAAEHGASNIRVFVPVGRGDATAESDSDFLVNQDGSGCPLGQCWSVGRTGRTDRL